MSIDDCVMGGHLPYREGQKLLLKIDDFYRTNETKETIYCLKIFTEQGLAYASEFNGQTPQKLTLDVQKRAYYRAEIPNVSDDSIVAISNPIWLD